MSSNIPISINKLSKCYQIYEKPHHRLMQMFGNWLGRKFFKEFWAISNVSFSIPRGKVVGILGKNGAGKSTLLQIICGSLTPTSGSVQVNGRVAALLELGSGFNPEFTGIENIYLNGQILGLSKEQISKRLPQILEFADIGDFVHQPVKTYSSGMFARLAFSVAVNVEPDILIVDEALSVGDAWFQHKSMARMRQLMESGCAVLFVSHSIDAVRALCDEAIWMEKGSVKMQGGVTEVTNAYMNDVFIEHNRITLQTMPESDVVSENISEQTFQQQSEGYEAEELEFANVCDSKLDGGKILSIVTQQLKNAKGLVVDHVQQGEAFSLEFSIQVHQDVKNISVGFLIKDQFGQELTGESYFNTHRKSLNLKKGQLVKFIFSSTMMLRGGQSYSVALRVNQVSQWNRSDNVILYTDELATVFDVLTDSNNPMWFKFKMPFEVTCK